jgi:hypothetical protein
MYFRTVNYSGQKSPVTELSTDKFFKTIEGVATVSVSANLKFNEESSDFVHKDNAIQSRGRFAVSTPNIKTSLSEGENMPRNKRTFTPSRSESYIGGDFVYDEARQRLDYVRKIMQSKSTKPDYLVELKTEEQMALGILAGDNMGAAIRNSEAWAWRNITDAPKSGISKYDFLEMDITIKFTASRNTGITTINPTPIPYTDYTVVVKNITKNRVFEIIDSATKYKYIKSKEIDLASGIITYVVRFYNDTYVAESNPRFKHWRTRPIFPDSPPPAYEYYRITRQDPYGTENIPDYQSAFDRGWYPNEYVEFLGPDFSKGDTLEIYVVPDRTKYSKLANYTPYTITMSEVTNMTLTAAKGQPVVY